MSSKTDYVYNEKDRVTMKSALEALKKSESTGYTRGIFAGLAVYGGLSLGKVGSAPARVTTALLSTIGYYSFSTHAARRDYAQLALKVNGKVSKEINQMMTFKTRDSVEE